jgi:hypothetical protein
MPVFQMRAPLSGANLMLFSGRVTKKELLLQFGAIDETQDQSSDNWLILDLGFADISDLDFDVLAKLKAILAPKMAIMKSRRPFDVAIVCVRPLNDAIYRTWLSFVGEDKTYPSNPLLFSDLSVACQRLGYGEAELRELLDLSSQVR